MMVVAVRKHYKALVICSILLMSTGFAFPLISRPIWFNIIVKIREAINVGDSGYLILASASNNFLYALQSTLFFLSVTLGIYLIDVKLRLRGIKVYLVSILIILFLHWTSSSVLNLPWEPVSTFFSVMIALFLFSRLFQQTNSFIQISVVSVQVFFAFQWLNIMPVFTPYSIGQGDIAYSIKTAGVYLHASSVLNFTGFAFFLPIIISAFITATLFISYAQNISMIKKNFDKESEIRNIKAKALENRIYQEVNSLVHDLKTPLVTIRGLNSLICASKSQSKLEEYTQRIESSVTKMNEMISSFLYEKSRQRLKVFELISYIRAQLPLDDDRIRIDIRLSAELPDIFVNKIRLSRAMINILENAIVVPYLHPYKHILLEVMPVKDGIHIIIEDNGIGIEPVNLSRIWEVGYSTNNTSGLGLPFAKQVIEENKGSIWVKSQPNLGTAVTVFLPLADSLYESNL